MKSILKAGIILIMPLAMISCKEEIDLKISLDENILISTFTIQGGVDTSFAGTESINILDLNKQLQEHVDRITKVELDVMTLTTEIINGPGVGDDCELIYRGALVVEDSEYGMTYQDNDTLVLKDYVDNSPVTLNLENEVEAANGLLEAFKAEKTIHIKYDNYVRSSANGNYVVKTTLNLKGKVICTVKK